MKQFLITISKVIFGILVLIISLFAIKGDTIVVADNANFFGNYVTSPFESSHSASRYALTKTIADKGTIFLNDKMAALSSPDLTKVGDKYISIFTPGISILSLPFYHFGSTFGYPQLATFFSTIMYSLLNIYLLFRLCIRMGSTKNAAIVASIVFAFATNAYAYSGTLAQHSLAVTFGIALLMLAVSKITLGRSLAFGLIYGIAVLSDIPNAILYLPQLVFFVVRHINFTSDSHGREQYLKVKTTIFLFALALLIPVSIFGYYNNLATGSFYKLGQRLGRAIYPPESTAQMLITPSLPTVSKEKFKQFDTERQIRGYYTLLVSDTRGLFYYSPILLIGLIGIIIIFKKRKYSAIHILALITVCLNIILYATFNDPWGGWAFGPRYLIPSAAFLSAFLSLAITYFKQRIILLISVTALLIPSLYISISGTLTTTVVPPDVYTESLTNRVHDDYQYNLEMVSNGKSSSLLYNIFLDEYISLSTLHIALTALISLLIIFQYPSIYKDKYVE